MPPPPAELPALASDLRILDRLAVDAGALGVVGEKTVVATTYLVLTSRLLAKQASLAVKGHSASGKSFTMETVVRLLPEEAVVVFTAMSQRSLVYSEEEYAHRTLIIYEAVALREGNDDDLTAYFVCSLLSEGRIVYEVTERGEDGNFYTRKIIKEGPTNLILTTTKIHVHAENETRVLSVTTDDSQVQTARVFAALADETEHNVNIDEWVQLQRWLAEHGEHQVTVPYAPVLAGLIPPIAVRMRRDFATLLALIRAHAMLHQLNRGRDQQGRVVATVDDDYAIVRELVNGILAENVAATVFPAVREAVQVVIMFNNPQGVTATVVARELKLDKSAARRRLMSAASDGYVVNLEDRRGRSGRWAPDAPLPEDVQLLPTADTVVARWQSGGLGPATVDEDEAAGQTADNPGGGTVADEPRGVKGPTLFATDGLPDGWRRLPYKIGCMQCGELASTADSRGAIRHIDCSQPDS